MTDETVVLIIFVPETHADLVRETLGKAGAGHIGNYAVCSYSVRGTGRFLPMKNANPAIGKIGTLEEVLEERIETVCYRKDVKKIIDEIKKIHPYEEPVIYVQQLLETS